MRPNLKRRALPLHTVKSFFFFFNPEVVWSHSLSSEEPPSNIPRGQARASEAGLFIWVLKATLCSPSNPEFPGWRGGE